MRNRVIRLITVGVVVTFSGVAQAQTGADSKPMQKEASPPLKPLLSEEDDMLGLATQNGNYAHYYFLPSAHYFKDTLSVSTVFSGSNLTRRGEFPLLYQWKAGLSDSTPLIRGKSSSSFTFQLSEQVYRRDSLLLTVYGTYVRGLVTPSDRYVFGLITNIALNDKWTLEMNLNRNQIITTSSTRETLPVSFSLTNFYNSQRYLSLRYSPHNVISRNDELTLTWGIRYAGGTVKPSITARGNIGIAFQILL
ncbi:MAG: hypothetical protein NT023_10070 [Armatimonadetes bacterium]|nr:hypothetical protein [Armatimonadota bacterium]